MAAGGNLPPALAQILAAGAPPPGGNLRPIRAARHVVGAAPQAVVLAAAIPTAFQGHQYGQLINHGNQYLTGATGVIQDLFVPDLIRAYHGTNPR